MESGPASPVVYTVAKVREDVATVRHALTHAPAGVNVPEAQRSFERLVRRFLRSEDDTQETKTP